MNEIKIISLQDKVIQTLKTCYDPEIPVDIWELGLIYELKFDNDNNLVVIMTLTSPMCPVAESLPQEVQEKLKTIKELNSVRVEISWNPPWNKDMMSEVAKVELGFF
jgi:FeS assembly SUF system protein